MSATDILNTEVEDLGPLLRQGLNWWLSELADLLPKAWRSSGRSRPALEAEVAPDGSLRFRRDGHPVAPPATLAAAKVTLILPRRQALVRTVETPAASERDTRRLLALDIDRLTPFPAEAVFAATEVGAANAGGRRRSVLAVIPREPALAALARARAAGLDPRAVGLGDGPELAALDFMPSIRQALGAAEGPRARIWWWAAVALMALANLVTAIGRDALDLAHRRHVLEREKPAFERAMRIRNQVLTEDRRRAADARDRARGEPLRILAAVTDATPPGAWVQRLAWNGQSVRVAGFETETTDIGAALRLSPVFQHVRNTLAEASPKATAGRAFDVTADVPSTSEPGRP